MKYWADSYLREWWQKYDEEKNISYHTYMGHEEGVDLWHEDSVDLWHKDGVDLWYKDGVDFQHENGYDVQVQVKAECKAQGEDVDRRGYTKHYAANC